MALTTIGIYQEDFDKFLTNKLDRQAKLGKEMSHADFFKELINNYQVRK